MDFETLKNDFLLADGASAKIRFATKNWVIWATLFTLTEDVAVVYYVDAAKMIRQYRLAERKSLPYSWFVQEGILIPYSLTPPVHYLRVIDELYFKEK